MKLTNDWKRIMLRAWSVRIAAAGIVSPEVLQLIADNTGSMTWLDEPAKGAIRLACLVGVLVLRPVKQGAL